MKKGNIILIGMPGSGKSTAGVLAAKALGMAFVDTDLLIQKKAGMLLCDIIASQGVDKLLSLEADALSDCTALESTVIATGGSAVFSGNALELLKKTGLCIFIDVPVNQLKFRIGSITTRGVAARPGETLDDIYCERLPLYKKHAGVTITPTPQGVVEDTVAEITAAYNGYNFHRM